MSNVSRASVDARDHSESSYSDKNVASKAGRMNVSYRTVPLLSESASLKRKDPPGQQGKLKIWLIRVLCKTIRSHPGGFGIESQMD